MKDCSVFRFVAFYHKHISRNRQNVKIKYFGGKLRCLELLMQLYLEICITEHTIDNKFVKSHSDNKTFLGCRHLDKQYNTHNYSSTNQAIYTYIMIYTSTLIKEE